MSAPHPTRAARVRINVFGGLRLLRDGVEATQDSMRRQVLLGVLLSARGATVSRDRLVDILWNDAPPSSAANQVHRLVGECRRWLEPGLALRQVGRYLTSTSAGYRLRTAELDADFRDLELLMVEAEAVEQARRPALFREIVRIASAPAFAGLPAEALEHPELSEVEEVRIRAIRRVAEAWNDAAGSTSALPVLAEAARSRPLDEGLQASLMQVLVRVGRRNDAIAVYSATAQALRRDLGVEPDVDLAAALAAATGRHDATRDSVHRSTQGRGVVPPTVAAYLARPGIERSLTDCLAQAREGDSPVAVLHGLPGVGKTSTATMWIRDHVDAFPGPTLHIDLQGFSGDVAPLNASDAVDLLLAQLGFEPGSVAGPLESRVARYRGLVADERAVVLLDNARDEAQVRPLLPGAPGSFAIITSRRQLRGLVAREAALPLELRPLSPVRSKELLRKRLSHLVRSWDDAAADDLATACAGLPLALALVSSNVAMDPTRSMRRVAAELDSVATRLDVLDVDEERTGLRAAFSTSYRALTEPAAAVLRAVSVHPASVVESTDLVSLTIRSADEVRRACLELVSASLLQPVDRDRTRIHDLVRLWAAEELRLADEERLVLERLLTRYALTCENLFAISGRAPYALQVPPVGDIEGRAFDDLSDAARWYEQQRGAVWTTVRRAAGLGYERLAVLMSIDLLAVASELDAAAETLPRMIESLGAARRTEDEHLIAELERQVAALCARVGDFTGARRHYEAARSAFSSVGDLQGEALLAQTRARLAHQERDWATQLEYAIRSVALARRLGEDQVIARALASLAAAYGDNGLWAQQAAVAEECRGVAASAGLAYLEPYISSFLAMACLGLDRPESAIRHAHDGLASGRKASDPEIVLEFESVLARAHASLGDRDLALSAVERYESAKTDLLHDSAANSSPDIREYDRIITGVKAALDAALWG